MDNHVFLNLSSTFEVFDQAAIRPIMNYVCLKDVILVLL